MVEGTLGFGIAAVTDHEPSSFIETGGVSFITPRGPHPLSEKGD
jgi:hypothetical protein